MDSPTEIYRQPKMGPPYPFPHTTRALLRALHFQTHGQTCRTCTSTTNLHLDHITPRHRGGEDSLGNTQILCHPCHTAKHHQEGDYVTTTNRRRVDIPHDLWTEISKDAAAIHLPVNAYITSLLWRALELDRIAEHHGPGELSQEYTRRTGIRPGMMTSPKE